MRMFLSVLSTVRQIVEQHVIKIGGPWPWLCAEKEKEKSPEPLEASSDFVYCICSDHHFLAAVPFSEHSVKHGGL